MLGPTTHFAAFDRSSNGPSGSRPVFGQNSNASSNLFTSNPFGSSTAFGSSTGGSEFGGTSTGLFGVNSPIPFQQPTFGSPLPLAFGTSTAAFGSPSGPVFRTSSSSCGAFGQSSTAAFGTSSVSGQNSTASSNPFTSNPFGSTTTFGTYRGGSIFGGTSRDAFGINSSSSGQQTFGNSTASFDATLAPAFGTSSGASIFAVKPPFGGFASSPNQSTSFGNTLQQAQTTFGTNPFGLSSSFSAVSQNALGSSSTSGSPFTPSFAFGTSGAFGATKSLGTSSTSAWGVPSTSAVGALQSPAFDASSTTRFSFVPTTRTVGLPNSATGSSTITSSFGTQSSSGGQSRTSTFSFGPQRRGSRLATYTATAITEEGKKRRLQSISCMHINEDKNHEELRWEDYQSGDKGGIGTGGFMMQSNSFSPSPTLVQSPVSSYRFSNFVYPKLAPQTLFTPKADLPHSTSTSLPFNTYPSASSVITISSSAANQFVAPPIPSFSWNPTSVSGFNSGLISSNTQPSPVFQSVVMLPQTSSFSSIVPPVRFNSGMSSANPQSSPIFQSVAPLPQTSLFQSLVPPLSQPNILRESSMPRPSYPAVLSQTTPFLTPPWQPTQSAQTGANSEFSRSLAGLSGLRDTTGVLGQSTFSLPSCSQNTEVAKPVPCVSPLGALPSMPQLSIGQLGSMPPIHYGISSMPVLDKPLTPAVRVSSLLSSRHLSHRRIRLPAQKFDPKRDGPKMPFFSDSKGLPTAAKEGAVFCRRENPRAMVVLPTEQWPQMSDTKKMSQLVHASLHVYKNGIISAEVSASSLVNGSLRQYEDYHAVENTNSNNEHKKHVTEVEASMPRLNRSDYYTEPQVTELAAKERAEPGFCCHVKNFVVGRHGYGSIKFLGETDVRNLDLDSHVKFNNREVMVYMDENEKPPVGEALNKMAEVTLLNIKCIDKMGNRYINGPKVDKYREMLIKKAKEQGAEFVSYDPVEGEWKFRVQHFSQYGF